MASKVCAPCRLRKECDVQEMDLQLPQDCMQHLMAARRTWACVYNVHSWCTYTSPRHACFAQPEAPMASYHGVVLRYREIEQEVWQRFSGPRKAPQKLKVGLLSLATAKVRLLRFIGPRKLSVCAYYSLYRERASLDLINRPDERIPELLSRGVLTLKGEALEV